MKGLRALAVVLPLGGTALADEATTPFLDPKNRIESVEQSLLEVHDATGKTIFEIDMRGPGHIKVGAGVVIDETAQQVVEALLPYLRHAMRLECSQ